MRAVVGILMLDVLYAGLGAAVLHAAGVTVSGPIRRVGLALATGWASFAVLASLALVAGLSLAAWQTVLIVASVAGLAIPLSRRSRLVGQPAITLQASGWRLLAGRAAAGVLGSYLLLLVLRALFETADRNYDSWAFWLPKAQSIYYYGGLDTGAGGFTSFDSPEYPPALPALHATTFQFIGAVETWALPLQASILGAAFFAAAGALLTRRVPEWILWPSLLALAITPRLGFYFHASLADLPVAYLLSLGGIAGSLWLRDRSRSTLVICAVFLAAASLTKSEGFALSIALVCALALASLWTSGRRLPLVGLAMVPVLALAVWKLWLAATDQALESSLYSTSDLLRPGYLLDRVDRLSYASGEVVTLLFDPGRWLVLAPIALVAGLVLLVRRSPLALFYLSWLVLAFAALVSVYWISTADIVWHVSTSADRVVASVMVFAGTLLPLLLAELDEASTHPARRRRRAES